MINFFILSASRHGTPARPLPTALPDRRGKLNQQSPKNGDYPTRWIGWTSDGFHPALVDRHYQSLYRFAYSLAPTEADANDLTQERFLRGTQKGGQLHNSAKVKSWLFTTLYRLFLNRRRHVTRFPHDELSGVELKLPSISSEAVRSLESSEVMSALRKIDETFRAPLVFFCLEDHSYQEIVTILEIPEGTVMSRLWRGKAMLREKMKDRPVARPVSNIIPMQSPSRKEARS